MPNFIIFTSYSAFLSVFKDSTIMIMNTGFFKKILSRKEKRNSLALPNFPN